MSRDPGPSVESLLSDILDVLYEIRSLLEPPDVKCKACGKMAPDYSGGSCEDCCIK